MCRAQSLMRQPLQPQEMSSKESIPQIYDSVKTGLWQTGQVM